MALIDIKDLTKAYNRRSRPVLDALDLQLESGQIVGLLGENGAGKTTLLKILAGLLGNYSGQVLIDGKAPGPETKAMVSFLADRITIPTWMRSGQVLDLYGKFFPDFDRGRAEELFDFFKLPTDRRIKEYSKGMREKMQIALAISRRARVYLLDEPISGVDPAARDIILKGILTNYDPQAILLISTHLIADVETVLDQALFIRDGKITVQGQCDDLRAQYGASIDQIFRKVYAS